jgi:MoxR-like ATPase
VAEAHALGAPRPDAALFVAATRTLRGAGYHALASGVTPRQRGAVSAFCAHVTASLRRPVDRYAHGVLLALVEEPSGYGPPRSREYRALSPHDRRPAVSSDFSGVSDVRARLEAAGYLPDESIETVVYLAQRLGKPILVEGPAGVGKTELAKAVATAINGDLIRLQCYEGLDEAKALYEWNYKKQLLRIQMTDPSGAGGDSWDEVHDDLFSEEYLLERPLLKALRNTNDTVLLIDEVDKVDFEFEALLLEILSDFQVTIPELGTVKGTKHPMVLLTSNNTRELSEALKRRCLYLYIDYPDVEREKAIVMSRVPEAPEALADQLVRIVRSLRQLELKKPPSISETLDWVRTLLELGFDTIDEKIARSTLNVLLKYQADLDKGHAHLKIPPRPEMN